MGNVLEMDLNDWGNENGNDGFEFGEMEMNCELKINEYDKLIMLNDFKIVCLSFGVT